MINAGCFCELHSQSLELHFRISTEVISHESQTRKRLLLYKHGDDLRQELLAIQFIEKCNQILLSSGLDLKLKTFSCQPVGNRTVSAIPFWMTRFSSSAIWLTAHIFILLFIMFRALSSGFEELFLYQNFARRQFLLIHAPIMVSTLARARVTVKRKAEPLDILFLWRRDRATRLPTRCLPRAIVGSSIDLSVVYRKSPMDL